MEAERLIDTLISVTALAHQTQDPELVDKVHDTLIAAMNEIDGFKDGDRLQRILQMMPDRTIKRSETQPLACST